MPLTATLPPEVTTLQIEEVSIDARFLLKTAVQRVQLLRLAMKGINAKRASEIIGCSHAHAAAQYRDPDFRRQVLAKVDRAFEDVDLGFVEGKRSLHELIETQAMDSFKDLVELLKEDIHPSLKVRIHQDFLNRCEDSQPQHKVNAGHRFSPEELQRAALTAREIDANLVKVVPIRREEKVG